MTNKQTAIHSDVHQKFKRSFRWTLSGSILYESLKALHCFLLLTILPSSMYGAMGSLFSLIYLVTYIADLGATNSLPPFINTITRSKQTFKSFLTTYSLLPHLPIILVCAGAATSFATYKITQLPSLWVIPLIITLETVRQFLRLLLHTLFQAKRIVVLELVIFFMYLVAIWGPYLILKIPITLNHIFIVHFLDSLLGVAIFIIFIGLYYRTLPNDHNAKLPTNLAKRLLITRLFNYLLRVSRNMFTSNFLTPLFAVKFGLPLAGLFYFSSTLANSVQAVLKSVIGYSGNALLATLKDSTQDSKREAFTLLCQKLMRILAPIIIILGINYKAIIALSKTHSDVSYTLSLFFLFLIVSFSEFFFMLYEQFYIIEEAANKLFFFKLFELTIFYAFLSSPLITTPVSTLLGIMGIRALSLGIIAMNAFYWWKIKPVFNVGKKYLVACAVIAYLFAWIISAF